MLPNRTICANLDGIGAVAELDPDDDVLVSWLPLYHDMGLVGLFMLPASTSTDLVLGAPQDFLAGPLRWMEWLSHYGGTRDGRSQLLLGARHPGPAERVGARPVARSASRSNGAEPVDPDSVERYVAAAAEHGMDPGAVFPAFGMAEVDDRWHVPGARARPRDRLRRPPRARDRALRGVGRRRRRRGRGAWRCSARPCPAWSCGSAIRTPVRVRRRPRGR